MAKKTKTLTTTTDTAKRKSGKQNLAKRNLKESAKEIKQQGASTREVMYLYPAECNTADLRKEFRRKARATARRLEKQEKRLSASDERGSKKELHELKQEVKTFKQSTYTHPN